MQDLFNDTAYRTSALVTRTYSTSFSAAVRLLDREAQKAIYSIYGFVRFADEIVDTFHSHDKKELLEKFEKDYYDASEKGISLNPILHAFQLTVKHYSIPDDLIQAFMSSMKTDLYKQNHESHGETASYIYGSAEVIGLMCLKVFVRGDEKLYGELREPARKLGSAFQKVNFLRDIRDDTILLNRNYFHHSLANGFNDEVKQLIVKDVEDEFAESLQGLKKLPPASRTGVLTAYLYYRKLLGKIKASPAEVLLKKRVRVPDYVKFFLLVKAYFVSRFM